VNICDPILSIITSIGYDHCESLGYTLEEIALNKAGIIKKNKPTVIGPFCEPI
jgi:dihydrofolate synthase/folylpolyglutamate synthase